MSHITEKACRILERLNRDGYLAIGDLTEDERDALFELYSQGMTDDKKRELREFLSKKPTEKGADRTQYAGEMFHDHTKRKAEKRRYYRNLILTSITTFCVGTVLSALFDSFGLGGALIGAFLVFAGYLLSVFG